MYGWIGGVFVLHDEEIRRVGSEWDSLGLKGLDNAAAKFAKDTVSLVGADADADGVEDLAAFDLVDAGDVGVGDDNLLERGIVTNDCGDRFEDAENLIGVGAGVDGDVDGGDGVVPGEVGDSSDLAVRDGVESAVAIAKRGAAEAEVFNGALESGNFDDLTYVVLVFDEDEDAVEHVLEDGLSTESDADTDYPCGG